LYFRLPGAYDFMRSVLRTERGGALYKQRAQIIEAIFGSTTAAFTGLARRGRSAARTEVAADRHHAHA